MGLYARLLDGSLTAGQALAYAKQAYYGSLGAVGVYDTKILQQTTFYGLPFWGITGHVRQTGATGRRARRRRPSSRRRCRARSPSIRPPDLGYLDHTVSPDFAEVDTGRPRPLLGRDSHPDGDEAPFATQNRPIQPQTVLGRRAG